MKTVDIVGLTKKINQFSKKRDWDQFHSIKNLSMALNVEASELLEIFQWMTEDDSNRVFENHLLKEKVCDEVADIFIYLLRISSLLNIDLQSVLIAKIAKNALKYPINKSKGNSKKYNEL